MQRRVPNDVGSVFGYRIRYTNYGILGGPKSHCILALVSEMLRTMTPTRREVAELLNKLMWSDPAFFNVLLYTQALQGLIHEIEHHWQWDERLTINSMAVRKLAVWRNNVEMLAKHRNLMILPCFAEF